MPLYTKNGDLLAELREALKNIRTVFELSEYLRHFRSPIVAECLFPAIAFFSKDCHKLEGKLDWKAIKERRQVGLKFQLTAEHEITPEIVNALWQWLCYPGYGRDLGTGFGENLLSSRDFGVDMPRYMAFDILTLLKERSEP